MLRILSGFTESTVYTDDSKYNNLVSCAFLVMNDCISLESCLLQVSLPLSSKALNNMNSRHSHVDICSDLLNEFQAIGDIY